MLAAGWSKVTLPVQTPPTNVADVGETRGEAAPYGWWVGQEAGMSAGRAVSEALRRAQLDFVNTYGDKAHPYYWAGFEVIGDGTRRIASQTRKP